MRLVKEWFGWVTAATHIAASLASTTIFNGRQSAIFPNGTSQACMSSFDYNLDCDVSFGLLYQQNNWVDWNATTLTALCTENCRTSFNALKRRVRSACADLSFELGSATLNAERIVDFYTYKYNLTCLSSGSSWCLLDEKKWFLEFLPTTTWPKYTDKWYPDWSNDPVNGTSRVDKNGTTILPYNTVPPPVATFESGMKQALDYRTLPAPATGTLNPNSTIGLEYDEYPLEIQCSSCFLQRFKLGFMSRWGETYDDVKGQAWDNIQKNCNFKQTLMVHPALKPEPASADWSWSLPRACEQMVILSSRMNCSTFSSMYKVSTAALRDLNKDIRCQGMRTGTYCLPESCEVAMQWYEGGISALELIGPNGPYNNISFTQFVRWNSAALHAPIFPGDYICIGPLGGAYVAPLVSGVAGGKPVYTTTASPAHETPPGTAENCGRYYDTVKDDYCQMIAMNFTLTFDDLRAMNPQINEECTNLWANASYCVATVQGSTAIPVPVTSATTFKPTSLPGTVAPSAPTQSGASAACYKWYTTVDGDYCYLVYTKFGISFDQLRQWNTVLDEACSNMWPGYAYCVEA